MVRSRGSPRSGGGKNANARKEKSAIDLRSKSIAGARAMGSKPDPIPDARKHTLEWIAIHHRSRTERANHGRLDLANQRRGICDVTFLL